MRVLNHADIAAVSGGADAPKPANPLVTGGVAFFNSIFTVFNVIISLPALLGYRG